MATLQMKIEDGKLVDHNGVYFEGFSEDHLKATGNGWAVTIRPPKGNKKGRIICHCERLYSDGPAVCHREFRLEDGLLGLAGGNVYDRYAYFRTTTFQSFLDRHGLTAVKRQDPNQTYYGDEIYCGGGNASMKVITDGKVDTKYIDDEFFAREVQKPGNNPNLYMGRSETAVSKATWAVYEVHEDYRDSHNHAKILYTQVKNVMSLDEVLTKALS